MLISPCVSHVLGRTVIWGSEYNKVNSDGIEVGGNKGDYGMSLGGVLAATADRCKSP